MSTAASFEETLESIQKEPNLTCELDSKIVVMTPCRGGYMLGLESGVVALAIVNPTIEITRMTSDSGGHTKAVRCIATTCDGLHVVTGGYEGSVCMWNVQEAKEEIKFNGHTSWVSCVAVTPNGLVVVSGSGDNTVRVWSIVKRQEEVIFTGHGGGVTCIAVTPDGSRVVSGSNDGDVSVLNIETNTRDIIYQGYDEVVKSLALTSDGSRVVWGSSDTYIYVWNIAGKKEEVRYEGHNSCIQCVRITQDNSYIISTGGFNVYVWSLTDRKEEVTFEGHTSLIDGIVLTADGSRIVSYAKDKTVRVWNLVERKEEIIFEGQPNYFTCIGVSSDGLQVLAANEMLLFAWNLAAKKEEIRFNHPKLKVAYVGMTCDNSRIAVTDVLDVSVWNLVDNTIEVTFSPNWYILECITFTPDLTRIVAGTRSNHVCVWNLTQKKEEIRFQGHSGYVTCVATTPDGLRVVSGSEDKSIRIWNLAEKTEEGKLEGHLSTVKCVVVTSDGSRIVSGGYDSTIRVWSLTAMEQEVLFQGHSGPVLSLALTPDNTRIVSGSYDFTVRLWSICEQREEFKFEGHSYHVDCLAVTTDGSRIVSGVSVTGTVIIWNIREKREELKLEANRPGEKCIAISPDASRLVVKHMDKASIRRLPDFSVHRQLVKCPSDLHQAVYMWKEGKQSTISLEKCCFPEGFNSLHIFAYFNRVECLTKGLNNGVPLIRGEFGSPLTLAIQRNSLKGIDAILQYFLASFEDPSQQCMTWWKFEQIVLDLPDLLGCQSSLLQPFFAELMHEPTFPKLPDFIDPIYPLPSTQYIPSHYIDISRFDSSKEEGKQGSILVKYHVSIPRWDFTDGGEQSLTMLKALAECEDKLVLVTPFVSAVIEDKWGRFYLWTLTLTCAYTLLLSTICCILFLEEYIFVGAIAFSILNAFFILYELAQFFANGSAYFDELLNYVDTMRSICSAVWGVMLLYGMQEKYFTLSVVVLCLLRGFTYFRSFKMTRIFVYMTVAVVQEMYSFLVILWYSVFAFSLINAVMLDVNSLGDAWKDGYNLLMGNFENSTYGAVEWMVFTCATVTNVVIMLNLLVSILGEAYEKTQMSIRENDLLQQLEVIIEYESMLFWRRHCKNSPTVVTTCKMASEVSEGEEWQGQILQITKSIKTSLESSIEKVNEKLDLMEERLQREEEKRLNTVEKQVGEKLIAIERQQGRVNEKIAALEEKLGGFGKGFNTLEEKLQVILSYLEAKDKE